jgi:hypothetical protein
VDGAACHRPGPARLRWRPRSAPPKRDPDARRRTGPPDRRPGSVGRPPPGAGLGKSPVPTRDPGSVGRPRFQRQRARRHSGRRCLHPGPGPRRRGPPTRPHGQRGKRRGPPDGRQAPKAWAPSGGARSRPATGGRPTDRRVGAVRGARSRGWVRGPQADRDRDLTWLHLGGPRGRREAGEGAIGTDRHRDGQTRTCPRTRKRTCV